MAREEKVWEYAIEAGYTPLGHLRITVCWRVQELACRKRGSNLKGS